jgi:hypothetical protein
LSASPGDEDANEGGKYVGETYVLDGEYSGSAGAGRPADDLREAVQRLGRALLAHPPRQPDRAVAEEALAALAREAEAVSGPAPSRADAERIHHALLLVAAAIGSISALAEPLAGLRGAVEHVAPPRTLAPLSGPARR